MFSIYLITNKENGKVYVGQTCKPLAPYLRTDIIRAVDHNDTRKPHLYNAIRAYGPESFVVERIAIAAHKWAADVAERFFIKKYNSQNKEVGYNIAAGGGGSFGYTKTITEEQREKYRLGSLGRKHTEETKKKMSEWHTGRVFTDEHKKNLSIAMKGKKPAPFSDEHKKGISEGLKEYHKNHPDSEETKKRRRDAMNAYYARKNELVGL